MMRRKHTPFAARLLRQALQDAPRDILRRIGRRSVGRRLSAWLSGKLAVVGAVKLAGELKNLCTVPGATVDDYVSRVIALADGAKAVIQIRFRDGDPQWPFVQWVASDFPVTDPAPLIPLARIAMQSFARLRPRCLRIWIPSRARWEPKGKAPGFEKGQRWLAAPLRTIHRNRLPRLPEGLRVIRASANSVFPQYSLEYQSYLSKQPQAAAWVHAEPLETLRDCDDQGGLFVLTDGSVVRGMVALRREAGPWFDGWYIVEAILFHGFRGRRLAVPMHRAAYAQLEARPDDFVWGTIDPRNAPAIATAAALGRVDIGGDFWIGPDLPNGNIK